MRIMALDLGEKRLGVALSDPTGRIAAPLTVLTSTGTDADLRTIADLAAAHAVERIVVGLPRTLRNAEAEAASRATAFAARLAEVTGLPVVLWDERLTTAQAERALLAADLRRAQRRARVDKVAAALILQSYLDAHGSPEPQAPPDQAAT